MQTKTVTAETWGAQLSRHVGRRFAPIAAELDQRFGVLGSRAQFDKLKRMEAAPTAPGDVLRAWLLLTVSGYNPAEFGVLDESLPPAMPADYLRSQVVDLLDIGGSATVTHRDDRELVGAF